ncbi:hypothetical protein CEXT_115191 [Caerostris extrusa]|uniref:Uncharacterized protein n=1 Tax=Caerostris extrusa TaxID=172846 RepID=A0AAV4Y4D0_CAEEX|nr:hypothetical protein CEXT_115191 [Caerostris extrusa]
MNLWQISQRKKSLHKAEEWCETIGRFFREKIKTIRLFGNVRTWSTLRLKTSRYIPFMFFELEIKDLFGRGEKKFFGDKECA